MKALPRQGESEKTTENQHVKPKALMLIRINQRFLMYQSKAQKGAIGGMTMMLEGKAAVVSSSTAA